MQKIIIANWKMNGSRQKSRDILYGIQQAIGKSPYKIVICPPFLYLSLISDTLKKAGAFLGAQNCYIGDAGAYTGEVSAAMLADVGCHYVIVGHSERRTLFQEMNSDVRAKACAVHCQKMISVLCVGENDSQRQAGHSIQVVIDQIQASLPETATSQNTLIAYEPIWAIGTGNVPTGEIIVEMMTAIRTYLEKEMMDGKHIPLLYGGSVSSGNSSHFLKMPEIDGLLVGGASLKGDEFSKILCS